MLLFFLWLLASMPQAAQAYVYNATTDMNKVVCVYPMSGSYSSLQRYNYYFLLVFILVFKDRVILVKAAAVTLMLFTTTTALHAFLLACITSRSREAFDLDAAGTCIILVISMIFLAPLMMYTDVPKYIKENRSETLFRLWGVWMAIGTISSIVTIVQPYETSYPCVNSFTNETMSNPLVLSFSGEAQRYNCTPTCFETHQLLRSPSTLTVSEMERVFGNSFLHLCLGCSLIGIMAVLYGLFACFNHLDLRDPVTRKKMKQGPKRGAGLVWIDSFANFSPAFLILIIVFSEIYLHRGGGLPVEEGPYTIGQWSCWVITAFVVIVALTQTATAANDDLERQVLPYRYVPSMTSVRMPSQESPKVNG